MISELSLPSSLSKQPKLFSKILFFLQKSIACLRFRENACNGGKIGETDFGFKLIKAYLALEKSRRIYLEICYSDQCDHMQKSSPILSKSCSKEPKQQYNILASFVKKNFATMPLKIAHSDPTVSDLPLYNVTLYYEHKRLFLANFTSVELSDHAQV